jgi:hypothetical protein
MCPHPNSSPRLARSALRCHNRCQVGPTRHPQPHAGVRPKRESEPDLAAQRKKPLPCAEAFPNPSASEHCSTVVENPSHVVVLVSHKCRPFAVEETAWGLRAGEKAQRRPDTSMCLRLHILACRSTLLSHPEISNFRMWIERIIK